MNLFCTLPCHPRPQIWNLDKEDTLPEMRGLIKTSMGGMGNQVHNNKDPAIINKISAYLTRWYCCWLRRAHSSPCPAPGPSLRWERRVQEIRVKYSSSVWKLGLIDIKVDKHQPIPYDSASDETQNFAGKLYHFFSFLYCAIYCRRDKKANK